MKKIFILFIALILNCNVVFASENFFNRDWWKTATVEDVEVEIANGADVNAKNHYGWTALMIAVVNNQNPEIVKALIYAGADVNAKNKNGTVLMNAVLLNENPEVIKALIDAGADVNAKNKEGNTALSIATILNKSDIRKMLIDAGARDVNIAVVDLAKVVSASKEVENLKKEREEQVKVLKEIVDNANTKINDITDVKAKKQISEKYLANIEKRREQLDEAYDKNLKITDSKIQYKIKCVARQNGFENVFDKSGRQRITGKIQEIPQNAETEDITDIIVSHINDEIKADFSDFDWWKIATLEDVKTEISKGADVNSGFKYAIPFVQNPEIIKILIDAGAKVDVNSFQNATRFNNNPEIIKILLDAGVDINAKDDYGMTALMAAAQTNVNTGFIKALLDAGADVNAKDKDGMTALMAAARMNDNPEVIKILLDAGADVNATLKRETYIGWTGTSPLMFAIIDNKKTNVVEVVKILIDAGADVNAEIEKEGLTMSPLGMAIERYRNENDKNNENYKIIELLINAGADVNAKLKTNDEFLKAEGPLLAFFIADKDNRIIEKLINSGADVNIQSGTILDKTSLLMTATKLKNIKKIKLLIDAGADVNAYSEGLWGFTALMSAVLSQNQEIIKMLIDAGADVNAKSIARDIDEDELFKNLYIPSEIPESERLEYKIKAKEFVNELREVSPNKEFIGATPLMIAARKANPEIIKILIDAGADTSLKSADNKTALDIARENNGNPEVIEILQHRQEFDEMFAECYSTQNIGSYANKFCKCAIKTAINALNKEDKNKAQNAFDDARVGTFKSIIQKSKSVAFRECY